MRDYKILEFWKLAHELAIDVYQLIVSFPKEEKYGLTSQLRRASLSVPTNIAEGCGRETPKDSRSFLVIASGSIVEVEYLLFFSQSLEFLDSKIADNLILEAHLIKKKLTSYKNKL